MFSRLGAPKWGYCSRHASLMNILLTAFVTLSSLANTHLALASPAHLLPAGTLSDDSTAAATTLSSPSTTAPVLPALGLSRFRVDLSRLNVSSSYAYGLLGPKGREEQWVPCRYSSVVDEDPKRLPRVIFHAKCDNFYCQGLSNPGPECCREHRVTIPVVHCDQDPYAASPSECEMTLLQFVHSCVCTRSPLAL